MCLANIFLTGIRTKRQLRICDNNKFLWKVAWLPQNVPLLSKQKTNNISSKICLSWILSRQKFINFEFLLFLTSQILTILSSNNLIDCLKVINGYLILFDCRLSIFFEVCQVYEVSCEFFAFQSIKGLKVEEES